MRAFVTCLAALVLTVSAAGCALSEERPGPPKKGDVWTPRDALITCDTDAQVRAIADAGKQIEDEKGLGPMGQKFASYREQINSQGNPICSKYEIEEGTVEDDPVHMGLRFNYKGDMIDTYLVRVRLKESPEDVYPVLFWIMQRQAPEVKPEPKGL